MTHDPITGPETKKQSRDRDKKASLYSTIRTYFMYSLGVWFIKSIAVSLKIIILYESK